MSKLGLLLGSETRANVLRSLALGNAPLTPYRVAKETGTNVPKVYLEMKRLAALGVIGVARRARGTEYELVDADLRRLVVRLSPRVVALEAWSSEEERASRFRAGFQTVPPFSAQKPDRMTLSKKTRLPGELDSIASLGRKRFDVKYRPVGDREFARV